MDAAAWDNVRNALTTADVPESVDKSLVVYILRKLGIAEVHAESLVSEFQRHLRHCGRASRADVVNLDEFLSWVWKSTRAPEDFIVEDRLAALERKVSQQAALLEELRRGRGGKAAVAPAREESEERGDEAPMAHAAATEKGERGTAKLRVLTYSDAFREGGGEPIVEQFLAKSKTWSTCYAVDPAIVELLPSHWSDRLSNSIKVNFQDYVDSLDELYVAAEACYKPFCDKIRALSAATGGRACIPPLKARLRAEMKARFKYRDDSGAVAWYRLTDLVRATVVYQDIATMYQGFECIMQDPDPELEIIEFNDRYREPVAGGYRDLQLCVRFRGHVCELQFNTETMSEAKESTGHRTFEVSRELQAAIAEGDVERGRKVLAWGKEILGEHADQELASIINDRKRCMMHFAAAHGMAEFISCFLGYKADADARNAQGRTPLHEAMEGGHERVAWALLNKGKANASLLDATKISALMCGCIMMRRKPDDERAARCVSMLAQAVGAEQLHQVRTRVATVLRGRYHNSTSLVNHAFDGHIAAICEELRALADPNSKDRDGTQALYAAAACGHASVVALLLHADADSNSTASDGTTALLAATMGGHQKVMAELLHARANVDARNAEYRSSLYLALDNGHDHVVLDELLAAGCEVSLSTLPPTGVSFLEGAGVGEGKHYGIVKAPNGLLYAPPHRGRKFLVADPRRKTLAFLDVAGSKTDGFTTLYGHCCCGPDGRIYCPPFEPNSVLVLDLDDLSMSHLDIPAPYDKRHFDWNGAAVGPDGLIYCVPRSAPCVLVVDPKSGQVSSIDLPEDIRNDPEKYMGIALGSDGRLYCSPGCAADVMVIDPVSRELSFITGAGPKGVRKYENLAEGADGRLYCAPNGAPRVLVIDPKTQALQFIELDHGGYLGICAGLDGHLYCLPLTAKDVLIIDSRSQEVSFIRGLGPDNKYVGAALGPDGRIYGSPYNASNVLAVQTLTNFAARVGGLSKVDMHALDRTGRKHSVTTLESGEVDRMRELVAAGYPVELDGLPTACSLVEAEHGYGAIAEGVDGRLYCAPCFASKVMVVDRTGLVSFIDVVEAEATGAAYLDIAAGRDGRLYCCPCDATKVLVIDPRTEALSFIDGAGLNKYSGIARGCNGRLYCSPLEGGKVLVIDPEQESLSFIEGAHGSYGGIAEGADGQLYCPPLHADAVLVINPRTDELSFIAGLGSKPEYFGIAAGADGRLYCAPHRSANVLVLDPKTQSASFIELPPDRVEYAGIAAGPDGRLYCVPHMSSDVLVIDPKKQEVSFWDVGLDKDVLVERKYIGITAGSDGRLYGAPHNATSVLVLKMWKEVVEAKCGKETVEFLEEHLAA